ncbi:MAG: ATP-binding protein [Pseudomonadota bacterium]
MGVFAAVFAATYYASEIGLTSSGVVALWPAAGITLWGTWRYGVWGAVVSFLAFYGYGQLFVEEFHTLIPASANGVAALLGAGVLRRQYDESQALSLRNLTWILVAGVVLSTVSAVVGGLHLSSVLGLDAPATLVLSLRWGLSDVAGVILMAPLLFAAERLRGEQLRRQLFGTEVFLALVLCLVLIAAMQTEYSNISISALALLLASPFIFWVMTRAATVRVLIALALVGLTALTLAARLLNHDNAALLETQLFMLVYLTGAIYIHILLLQITAANAELAARSTELEQRVDERTRELSDAKLRAELADQSKSQFLANTSHEVRTPLNGILGMAEQLELTKLSADQRDQVQTIITSGRTLLSLLNDVIDLSKVEAGRLEIAPIPTDLRRLLEEVRSLWLGVAEQKNVGFDFEYAASLGRWYLLDPVRLKQCLSNLVSNALKFTDAGRVTVTAEVHTGENECRLSFRVRDTGIGMDAAAMAKLFQPFEQLDSSITRRFGGTGLGLAITRNLIGLMGGEIAVQSEPGAGSEFTFFVTTSVATAPVEKKTRDLPAETANLVGLRTLLVEDNKVNRLVAHGYLKKILRLTDAENGVECLERLSAEAFDLVLLDIHMPVMGGEEAIREIRASDKDWQQIPVIALTADAMSEDRTRLLNLGFDGYASKPIDRKALLREIESVVAARGYRGQSSAERAG